MGSFEERVRPEPFMRFIEERIEYYLRICPVEHKNLATRLEPAALVSVCRELGWLEKGDKDQSAVRKLYRYRHGIEDRKHPMSHPTKPGKSYSVKAESFNRAIVEEALHFAGFRFTDYYPEFELPEYPEYYCVDCKEVGPHEGGFCIWCLGRSEYAAQEARKNASRAKEARRQARLAA